VYQQPSATAKARYTRYSLSLREPSTGSPKSVSPYTLYESLVSDVFNRTVCVCVVCVFVCCVCVNSAYFCDIGRCACCVLAQQFATHQAIASAQLEDQIQATPAAMERVRQLRVLLLASVDSQSATAARWGGGGGCAYSKQNAKGGCIQFCVLSL
jgi:hypothetical protein